MDEAAGGTARTPWHRPARPTAEPGTAAHPAKVGAFERGLAALAQFKARTGSVTVPKGPTEQLDDGTEMMLGVVLSNTKSRRAKLTAEKRRLLAGLGLTWAAEEAAV
ncbi:Helicase associated domain protein [Streptomyces sp. NPDC094468]|uniref:Helicase associated domain protein n=1 Tax=Streptomyces sp. NPDC094468 TaxID=3366066 RepID=UPI00382BA54A